MAVVGISHHIVELLPGEMNERTMVSALKVDITFAFEVFIDDTLQRVGGPKRRDRARLAIGKKAGDFVLGRQSDGTMKYLFDRIDEVTHRHNTARTSTAHENCTRRCSRRPAIS